MSEKHLMILEVSQKQAYIFGEKKLHDNILASDTIAYVTSSNFFKSEFSNIYSEDKNLIYAGGGHTILIFDTKDEAKTFAKSISKYTLENLPDLELFIKINLYDESKNLDSNIIDLMHLLDVKKSLRKASFHQASIGIENNGRILSINDNSKPKFADKSSLKEKISKKMNDKTAEAAIGDFYFCNKFEDLGGSKGKNNFIAVIHIDGNQMGARVQRLSGQIEKEFDEKSKSGKIPSDITELEYNRQRKREFSESIDKDFKGAFYDMLSNVTKKLTDGSLADKLSLHTDEKTGKVAFPIRKVITAGDDICFVTEGRIGLECAVEYIKCLSYKTDPVTGEKTERLNSVDNAPYKACAGVAIVHQKYPFYRAYDMAEQLCSNAKKEMARRIQDINSEYKKPIIDDGSLSAIDWHIDYGEMVGELEDIRESYFANDKTKIYERPYQITKHEEIGVQKPDPTTYEHFKHIIKDLQNAEIYSDSSNKKNKEYDLFEKGIARSKLKNLRNAIKKGKRETRNYCTVNLLPEEFGNTITYGELFDALEAMDLFLSF